MEDAREVNIPLLRKAVEWAEAEAAKPPELCEWDQQVYRETHPQAFDKADECGTCYCVAGYVVSLINTDYALGKYMGPDFEPSTVAADALGIAGWDGDHTQGSHLFSDDNTIEDVRRIAEDIAGERL